jgi:hypothetical protein
MTTTQTAAQATAAAKREVREALAFAGFTAEVFASKAYITVQVADAADRPAILQMYPDAIACEWNACNVYITR